ncbi:MAG: hypothetical protein D6677_06905 [Calditrichaeota bacterium]|nr:MAG: hypothetical protein D6677_06905 [Calditrichota bacterium]
MKKLIAAHHIREAQQAGGRLEYDGATHIVTPQARSLAAECHVELVDISASSRLTHADMHTIVERVRAKLPHQNISRARIEEVIKQVVGEK